MKSPQSLCYLSSSSNISILFYGLAIMCLISATVSASYGSNETDYLALLSFKSMITHDPYKVLTSWNHSFHFCDWSGISCGKRHKRVTALRLNSKGLQGSLSLNVGNLSFLRELSLANNSFQGNIPHELGRLFRLRRLYLDVNEFSGVIPTNLSGCSNLEVLSVGSNYLAGSIPKEISLLSKLTRLVIYRNMLTGGIPPFLGNITSLEWFVAFENHRGNPFGGSIPDNFGHWKSLTTFVCGDCNLYGSIPLSIFNHSLLVNLSLPDNHLTGSLPSEIDNLPNLELLQLRDNELTGVLPPSISNFSKLRYLEMGGNNFHGTIPNLYSECGYLEGMILNGNQLEGEVPHSLSKCRSLKVLDFGNNQLNGTFPEWLGGLLELQVLVLRSNKFHGPIETNTAMELAFSSLHVLDLSYNKFVGKLPVKYFQNFKAMKNIVSNSTKPRYLYMAAGGDYYTMIVVVKDVQLTFTKLLLEYTIVDLSNNNFEGEIPNTIGSLNSLKVLNLSHNNLNGGIPNALGNISEIESLDLSWNQLMGEIPQSLVDIKGLSVLNLSQNRLEGRIPQGKQFNTFDVTSYGGNLGLCGFPLSNKCEHLSSFHVYGDGDEEESDEIGFTWKVVMLGYGCGTLVGLVMGYIMLSTRKVKWFNAIADAAESLVLKKKKRRHVYIGK